MNGLQGEFPQRSPARKMETKWTLREQLILASAVQKSGDQNWVSVTRAIKPLMEDKRQHDFFSQKNCAMQYAKMLDKANTPKRTKRASRDSDVTGETAQEVIVRQLTEKRIVELDQLLERIKEEYMTTKKEIEDLQNDKLTEKEMQLMLEEMSSSQKTVEDPFGSAVHSPLGTDESKTVDNTMDMDTADASQSKVSVVGECDPPHSVPVVHTPLVQCVRSKEQPEVKSPGESTSPEAVSPLPVEQLSQKTCRAASMSPTPSEPYSSPQMKSPPQSETQHQSDTPLPSPFQPVGERSSQVEEPSELVPTAAEEEELFYASVSWCEKEHAYASKSTSPSSFYRASPIPTLLPTNSSLAYTDATLVSRVKSMIVAMGNENVLVSDYKVAVDGKCEEPSQSLFRDVGKQESQEMDKEPGDVDSKSEDEEMEKMDDLGKKDEQDSAVVKVDDKKMDEDESEQPISPKEAPHEEERDDEGREDLPLLPKPEQFSKEQSRSPDIDVESITSSPPTKDHDDDTPSVTPIAPKGSRKGKAKRKGAKKEVVEDPTKSEEKVKDRVSSLKGKTRSSKRGGAKKEDSEAEEEEISIITPRRSGRVKDKKEKQEDSEMEESTAHSSTVNSPVPSLSDLTPDVVQSHKAWKKAIMLVWRQIAQHKYANLFLQPVKDDDATGYSEVVHRPVDLSSIKKNIESGVIRSDIVFQRDILLMFQNALMYNSSDHDVYKMAEEMRSDSMEYIQDYLATQLMVSQSTGKPTVRTRRAEAQERQADEDLVHKKGSRKPSSEETSHTAAKRKKL